MCVGACVCVYKQQSNGRTGQERTGQNSLKVNLSLCMYKYIEACWSIKKQEKDIEFVVHSLIIQITSSTGSEK